MKKEVIVLVAVLAYFALRKKGGVEGADARYTYLVKKGTSFWKSKPSVSSLPDGSTTSTWGIFADGVLGHSGDFVHVNVDGTPVWISDSDLVVNVLPSGKVSGKDVVTHWYGPAITAGAFSDVVSSLEKSGIVTAGEPPIVTCKLTVVTRPEDVDVTFALVHDTDGEVRAVILDHGALSLTDTWLRIDQAMKEEGLS